MQRHKQNNIIKAINSESLFQLSVCCVWGGLGSVLGPMPWGVTQRKKANPIAVGALVHLLGEHDLFQD